MTSLVLNDDVVPRMSAQSIEALADQVSNAKYFVLLLASLFLSFFCTFRALLSFVFVFEFWATGGSVL